ncbi:phosphotransferase [Actinopolymorpha alba]|uniref:phosphotransferase n=1 Tax=Actinopolymorpha alba TaxID=533267 RepID=UPI0012F6564B|nr:phosphotransferase [Actinopolymorpha alba]
MPIEPRPCALPYGLTWRDLGEFLPGFVGAEGARAWVSHEKRGLHKGTNSCIVTVSHRGVEGSTLTQTVFCKRSEEPARAESARYAFLSSCGFPTPKLLYSAVRDGGEVVVLEFVPTIGVEPSDVAELLRLIARLNALEAPPAELFMLPSGMPAAEFCARVKAALTSLAADPAVSVEVDPESWFDAYRRAEAAVAALPTALNHGELYLQQVGWSRGRLVMFDLETMGQRPRFTDIATTLAGLAAYSGREEWDLFASYLEAVRHLTGVDLDGAEAWKEVLLVRTVDAFAGLPWRLDNAGNPDLAETPTDLALALHDDLRTLGLLD